MFDVKISCLSLMWILRGKITCLSLWDIQRTTRRSWMQKERLHMFLCVQIIPECGRSLDPMFLDVP